MRAAISTSGLAKECYSLRPLGQKDTACGQTTKSLRLLKEIVKRVQNWISQYDKELTIGTSTHETTGRMHA